MSYGLTLKLLDERSVAVGPQKIRKKHQTELNLSTKVTKLKKICLKQPKKGVLKIRQKKHTF